MIFSQLSRPLAHFLSDLFLPLGRVVRAPVLALLFLFMSLPAMATCSAWRGSAWLNEYFFGTGSFLEVYSNKNSFPPAWQNWSITVYEKSKQASYPLTNNTAFACTKAGNKTWLTTNVSSLPGTEGLVILRDASGHTVDAMAFDNNETPPAAWTSNTSNYFPALASECPALASALTTQAGQINQSTNKYLPNMLYADNQSNKNYSRTPDGLGNDWSESSFSGAGTTYTTCTSNNANLTKTVNVTEAPPGGGVSFILTLANPSSTTPIASGSLLVSDPLPAGLLYVSATSTGAGDVLSEPAVGASGGTLTWTPATIPAGGRAVLTINLTVPTAAMVGTIYTNTATTSGSALSGNQQSDTVSFSVVAPTTRSFLIIPDRQTSCKNPTLAQTPIITIAAKDQINGSGNTITSYLGTVTLGTSSAGNTAIWSKVSGAANGTLTLTTSGATYAFDAADQGLARFYLSDTRAESLDITATDWSTYAPATMSGLFSEVTYENTCSATKPLISVGDASLNEGDAGTQTLLFPVTLSFAAPAGGVSVSYATSNLSATAGSDYVAASGTLTLAAGATSGTLAVTVNGDTVYEAHETLVVTLSNPVNALLGDAIATGTLLNDDSPQLRAHYPMDETVWTSNTPAVLDSSGLGLHATVYNASAAPVGSTPAYPDGTATPSTCGFGYFDGAANTYVQLPTSLNNLPAAGMRGYTVTGWVKASAASGTRRIVSNSDGTHGWALTLTGGTLGFTKQGGSFNAADGGTVSATSITANTPLANDVWHFIALTVDTQARSVVLYSYAGGSGAAAYTNRLTATYTASWTAPGAATYVGGEPGAGFNFVGAMDEVRFYDGALPQSEIESLRMATRACAALGPHHYEVSLPATSITCLPTTVTVTACADSTNPCTSVTTSVTGTPVLATSAGTISAATAFSNGVSTALLSDPLAVQGAVATVSLSSVPQAATQSATCRDASCSTTFSRAGFIFSSSPGGAMSNMANQVAGTASSTYYLRAVQASTSTSACVAALPAGPKQIDWAYQCNDPGTCTSANFMTLSAGSPGDPVCADGTPATGLVQGNPAAGVSSYSPLCMTFDGNGSARFSLNYGDVGRVKLWANTTLNAATLLGSSSDFVVKPGGFVVSGIKQTAAPHKVNPAASSANADKFVKAGEAFTLTVRATTSGGATTPSYGREASPEGVRLAHALVLPSGGVAGTLGGSATMAGAYFQNGATQGEATVNDLTWDEVGIITLSPGVGDASYLGAGDVTAVPSTRVGRFYPDHFDVSIGTQGALANACLAGGFTYTGQAMRYDTAFLPSLTIKPMNAATPSRVTQNYTGDFQKLTAPNVSIALPTQDATQLGKAATRTTLDASSSALSTGTLANNAGTLTYTLSTGDQFVYQRDANAMVAPYTTALALSVTGVTEPVGADGVTASGTLPTLMPTGALLRYGRARMLNAYGSERLDLPVVLRTEYLANTSLANDWRVNTADRCSTVDLSFMPVGAVDITGRTCVLEVGNLSGKGCAAALTSAQPGRGFLEAGVSGFAGNFNVWLKAPGAAYSGSIDVHTTVDAWLLYPWTSLVPTSPKARATFGAYKSPLIYRRENY